MIHVNRAVGKLSIQLFWLTQQCTRNPMGNVCDMEVLKFTTELRAMLNMLQILLGDNSLIPFYFLSFPPEFREAHLPLCCELSVLPP